MPKVGMKEFTYDQDGMNKANEEARRTGLPVEYEDRNYAQYNAGGRVLNPGRLYEKAMERTKAKRAGTPAKKAAKKKAAKK
jgi:hypothetical protein